MMKALLKTIWPISTITGFWPAAPKVAAPGSKTGFPKLMLVWLCLTPMMTSCAAQGEVSKATYLGIALEATTPEPPQRDCAAESLPDPRPFPIPNRIEIVSAAADIEQGREYGETLKTAQLNHEYREGQINAYTAACEAGFTARVTRHDSKTAIRKKLIDEMSRPDPKWWEVWK